ncbi:putative ATPase involved in replication control, Cdc46/Mcm family [Vibrio nigripulchritudo SFn27]|uniref:Putative ATPase involved in replication control, Cdc46/Mcm family n=1 Tax=Vibrio nigripulchritudo TaxID=28173 RepID=U4KFD1_9VIBR|nr:hypothetical protein [Vibrio nigripulchritudo]CCN80765.1 putative ATPase involved in replication control, Cdc46/Mcm family [Vibrio nigripulchritudo BLFn1]CCN88165.1 putative ATPase involved in replication control, Cdc46/Mcm family [Vibrio nigripulchritudo SFn27]CCN93674.1 putative ATPase involved in replication control, Cdc46/Mcm family [Vibrio nigripulchritudo ENn2]CCO43547.1 putative ATPase involved in replication control, Cdc46/Mcm family [Vibrio nigripulchritudo SFn135]CCO53358.1 putati
MNFQKIILAASMVLSTTAFADTGVNKQTNGFKFEAGSSVFEISEVDKIGIYSKHEYKFNGKKLGFTELVALNAKQIGTSEDADYFVVKGSTGGSACAEVLSIVKVTNDYLVFSPTINACGGIVSIEYVDDRDINRVNVKVLERDERTRVSYKVVGSTVLVNGRNEMKDQYSFLKHN